MKKSQIIKTVFAILMLNIIPHKNFSQNSIVDSLIYKIELEKDQKKIVNYYAKIGNILEYENPDSARYYYEQAYNISKLIKNNSLIGISLMKIGGVYEITGRLDSAKNFYNNALIFLKKANNQTRIASDYNSLGNIFYYKGDYKKSLEYYQKSLKIYESLNDEFLISCEYHNIGLVHDDMQNYNRALKYYKKALINFKKFNDLDWLSTCYNSIGCTYSEIKNYKKAEKNYEKSLIYYNKLGDKLGVAIVYENIGIAKTKENLYNDALIYLNKSLKISTEIEDYTSLASVNSSISKLYFETKKFNKSIYHAQKSILFAKKSGSLPFQKEAYSIIKKTFAAKGIYKTAYLYSDSLNVIKDTIFNHEKTKAIEEMESKYQSEIKQQKIEKQKILIAKKNAEVKKKNTERNAFISGFVLMLILAFIIFRSLKQKKKANLIISEKNKNITDSINYAQKIQNALLPPEHYLKNILNDYFVLFKPKDIVSGDFYWVRQNNHKIIVAAADCTGHGVPGAFMSILGTTFLNEINHLNSNVEANEILNILSQNLKETLHQTDDKHETRDGMDIALYIIDTEKQVLQFSGAYNPLYLIRNKKLNQYKADKMPIGLSRKKEKSFTNHEINLETGDSIYIFSDGYIDQFDKTNKEKFKTKRFQELLVRINGMPMNQQKNILNNTIEEWRGEVEQIDDILVVGVKI